MTASAAPHLASDSEFCVTSQRYQDVPCNLAATIQWFLDKEKEILQSAGLPEKVGLNGQSYYLY